MAAQTKTAEPTIVNGINVDDMFALIEDVRRNPAKGKTNSHVTIAKAREIDAARMPHEVGT